MTQLPASGAEPAAPAGELARLLRNWRAECDSAVLYEALAALVRDSQHGDTYRALAAKEREHAAFWKGRLICGGHAVPGFRPSWHTRFLILLARCCGVGFVIPAITVREMRDRDTYASQEDAQAAGLARDEHGHAAVMRGRVGVAFGNSLRAAVLGADDGLVSNFCLMMAVAGGGAQGATLVLTGFAGLIAGAASMALGEWLSVTNARELAISQMDREIGQSQPAHPDDVQHVALGNAWSAAGISFLLFALGAIVPLLPFCFVSSRPAIVGSIVLSLVALFLLGVATSLFNGRSGLFSGLRQTGIGAAAAAVTYLAGRIFGALAS